MGYTKRQFIEAAYEELGLAAYTFDLEPEMLESALRRLDAMMAEWNSRGIRLGYPIPLNPTGSSLDEQTSVPDRANNAIITNLAVVLAPSRGKTLNPSTILAAKNGLNALLARAAMPGEIVMPATIPRGAGDKDTSSPFFEGTEDRLDLGPDSSLTFD